MSEEDSSVRAPQMRVTRYPKSSRKYKSSVPCGPSTTAPYRTNSSTPGPARPSQARTSPRKSRSTRRVPSLRVSRGPPSGTSHPVPYPCLRPTHDNNGTLRNRHRLGHRVRSNPYEGRPRHPHLGRSRSAPVCVRTPTLTTLPTGYRDRRGPGVG